MSELDQNVNDNYLFQFFKKKFANTVSAKVVTDSLTRKSKGYGFVKFSSNEDAQKAIRDLNNTMVLSKNIRLRYCILKLTLFSSSSWN